MGPPPTETGFRTVHNTGPKTGTDRPRNDTALLDNANRRPGVDRNASRNNGNSEDIVLGPPRTTFNSATLSRGIKPFDADKGPDRFATFRTRNGEGDSTDRPRDRDRSDKDRDGRTNFRRRGDGDQDSDGWSTVKPRKSFGHEGAERFHGRMGERPDRFGSERRPRDNQEDGEEKVPRRSNFGEFGRDREAEENERPRRNGTTRTKTEQPPWARGSTAENEPPPARERFDRGKSWRDRDRDDGDKHKDRNYDRRWDRDQRQEREPEWLDEPSEEKTQGHTEEDFKRFMENMKASKGSTARPGAAAAQDPTGLDGRSETANAKIKSAPAVEMGPDKFFANFASPTPGTADKGNPLEVIKDSATSKPKTGSRFQNFFSSQEERRQTEPSTPAAAPPQQELPQTNPLLAFANAAAMGNSQPQPINPAPDAEKMAFQALLQKLQKQSLHSNSPPSAGFGTPPQAHEAKLPPMASMASPGPFQEPMGRGYPPQHEIHAPRPQQPPAQLPPMLPEQQILHDLIGQRHPPSQGGNRADQNQSRNSNTQQQQFLMTLMQSARNAPEPPRPEQLIRMPQPSRPAQIPQTPEREMDFPRERSAAQHQGRPQGLPSFFDEPHMPHEHEAMNRRQPQPTQILQRQAPPGLDHMPANPNWVPGGNQILPPAGRPMIPPPGLAGNRNGPMPGPAFPPNFPPGMNAAFPPEFQRGPPPGFYGGPPPGLFPPGFQGAPEQLPFNGFDGRGMPPGAFRR